MMTRIRLLAVLACLAAAGCRTDVNPSTPHAKTGYVDFYTDSNEGLCWEVKQLKEPKGEMRTVFCEFKPLPGNILRLAVPAGTHRFQVWFNNEFTTGPQTVSVQVANAKVTPVHVSLGPAGESAIQVESYEYRATARATRRVTKTSSEQQQTFRIVLAPATPRDYQPKERMPYFSPAPK